MWNAKRSDAPSPTRCARSGLTWTTTRSNADSSRVPGGQGSFAGHTTERRQTVADQTSRSHNEEAPLPPDSGLDVRTEELRIETTLVPGTLYIARRVDEVPHDQPLTRRTEHAHVEHVHPHEPDSGKIETLPDGSLSIPVLQEH